VIKRNLRTFVVTGTTGFLGKVLLEELVRRAGELEIGGIGVVIRPKRGKSALQRFAKDVAGSPCFSRLPIGWTNLVTVLDGNIEAPLFGLSEPDLEFVRRATHFVHAAASVQFDLPLAQAAAANVTASLNALELARHCVPLDRFVYVSTAYVTPHRDNALPVREVPVALPANASALYDVCLDPASSYDDALRITGHPNSYTFTKTIAETLLVERHGNIPLSIVRPSIVTASRALPFRGWIDSAAGFSAFAVSIGMGHLRALVCEPEAKLDLVPVDEVSHRIVDAAVGDSEPLVIRHAVAGAASSPSVRQCRDGIQKFFHQHRVDRRPSTFVGPRAGLHFRTADFLLHQLPVKLARENTDRRRAEKRMGRVNHLNDVYAYFTTRTFNFETSVPLGGAFDGVAFVHVACQGAYRHLLRNDDSEWTLAGRAHPGFGGDLAWARERATGGPLIRAAAWLMTKLLRRTVERLTVDVPSFDRALAAAPAGAVLVLTPSHRSYLDFVLCMFLASARPDLLPMPHFAATSDFARVPVLGWLFTKLNAFYVRRGKPNDPELARNVERLMSNGEMIAFFIEGARSRSGAFLQPKRGLLRALQATGRTSVLLPVAVSYERVPERDSFDRELAGEPKSKMRLSTLISWTTAAWRGKVDLGRIHIACGEPVVLDANSDVRAVSHTVIDRLRGAMREPEAVRQVATSADMLDAVAQ
jgi:thioester reductase-like protein/1-acyl-sn-glycerol-3-phosphate acyltransferase